jgi:hypothetical protein
MTLCVLCKHFVLFLGKCPKGYLWSNVFLEALGFSIMTLRNWNNNKAAIQKSFIFYSSLIKRVGL